MNLRKFFNQTAVYWAPVSSDGFGGFTFADPVEVDVRWTDKQERFLSGSVQNSIEERLSRATILSEYVFEVNGRMMLGNLVDLSSDETEVQTALIVDQVSKIPDKNATSFLVKSWLL